MLRTRVGKANVRPQLLLQYNFNCRHDKWQTHFFSRRRAFFRLRLFLNSSSFCRTKENFVFKSHEKLFYPIFFHCLCCLYIVVYTFCVEIKQTGAVFCRLLLRFLDRKSGVLCTIFRQSLFELFLPWRKIFI